MLSVAERVKDIIAEELGVERSSTADDDSFTEDLGADSMDMMVVIMSLEKEFDIDIHDEDAEKICTVGEAVKYLQGRVEK